jgi:hypothetical protein
MKTMEMFFCAFSLLLTGGCFGKAETEALIVNPKQVAILKPSVSEKTAVDELKLHFKLITGEDVPVVSQIEPGKYVFKFEPGEIAGNQEACAWTVGNDITVFRGNAYFAVIDFLENALGVRWAEEDLVSFNPDSNLVIGRRQGEWTPALRIREMRGASGGAFHRLFANRMRAGRHQAPRYGHAFTRYWLEYGRNHREYFAMRPDGIRGPMKAKPEDLQGNVAVYMASMADSVAMCCSSTGLVETIVEKWRKDGCYEYINLCENDVPGQNSCRCTSCVALDVVPEKVDPKWETHYSDRYVYFGNKVLEAARRYRKDVKVSYYAYNATQDAPRRFRPDPASVLGVVPTYFTDEYVRKYVESWKNAGLVNFFYRPNRHCYYNCPYLPIGSEEHFFDILKYLVSSGCIGFDYDGPGSRNGGFEWFERYVLLHAMQDPSKSFAYWENHYFQAYGAAAEDAKAYYRFWREEVWNKRLEPNMDAIVAKGLCFNFGRGLVHNLKDYYRESDFAAAEHFVLSAEAKLPMLGKGQSELVRRLRKAHDHALHFFKAVAFKSKTNTQSLIEFRRRNGYPLYTWSEQYYGDITGVEKLLGPEKKVK